MSGEDEVMEPAEVAVAEEPTKVSKPPSARSKKRSTRTRTSGGGGYVVAQGKSVCCARGGIKGPGDAIVEGDLSPDAIADLADKGYLVSA